MDLALVHRLFYPQVPLVFAASHGRRVSAMPVVSYASLSMRPPLVGVACFPSGYTLSLALKSKAFSLSLLDARHLEKETKLAATSGTWSRNKVRESGLHHSPGPELGAPLFRESSASLECRLKSKSRTGDHLFVVGEVVSATVGNSFADSWDFTRYSPVLYAGWKKGKMTVYEDPRRPGAGARQA